MAPPASSVTLYEGAVALGSTTADSTGRFSFDLGLGAAETGPGRATSHELHAVAIVGGVAGPASNVLFLTVDPTLRVDPVHIMLTTREVTQHLRDNSGYANLGGQVWTRTGDVVEVSIPIACTDLYDADLYVGGVLATSLIGTGNDVHVGAYTPPTSGSYQLDLHVRCGSPTAPVETINLLTGLIDPDGYVYDLESGLDYRLSGASITCYELVDEASDTWQVWNGGVWGQQNPQRTASDGYYSFFTLPGTYKILASLPGYWPYESPPLTVIDEPVHHNVGLASLPAIYLPLVFDNH